MLYVRIVIIKTRFCIGCLIIAKITKKWHDISFDDWQSSGNTFTPVCIILYNHQLIQPFIEYFQKICLLVKYLPIYECIK